MKNVVNVILTRDPEDMLPSYDKVIQNPSLSDTGYDAHIELLDYFNQEGITLSLLIQNRYKKTQKEYFWSCVNELKLYLIQLC